MRKFCLQGGFWDSTDNGVHTDPVFKENQGWNAYESDTFDKPYNWRLATDNDIASYLARFVHIQVPKIGNWNVQLMDDGIMLDDGGDYSVLLDAEELVQLGKIINERVVG